MASRFFGRGFLCPFFFVFFLAFFTIVLLVAGVPHPGGLLGLPSFSYPRGTQRASTPLSLFLLALALADPGTAAMEFEFFKVLIPRMYEYAMTVPRTFAQVAGCPHDLSLQLNRGSMVQIPRPLWPMKLVKDDQHSTYSIRGDAWRVFVSAHKLKNGDFLVFLYDGLGLLSVKVFEPSGFRKPYLMQAHGGAGGIGNLIDHGAGPSNQLPLLLTFTSYIKPCNMGTRKSQYLLVPMEFAIAHTYAERTRVKLMTSNGSWVVSLNRNIRTFSFAEGWHQFRVCNGVQVGDSCCFTVEHEGAIRGDGNVKEEEEEGENVDDHVLRVEIIKRNCIVLS